MPTTRTTILALDPGTKELGVAVLSNGRLEFYGVKTFKQRQPPHCFLTAVADYISSLITAYHPVILAIETTFSRQKNAALLQVAAAEIIYAAKQHGLTICEYNPAKVRQIICRREKATKPETAQLIVRHYPELSRYLKQPTRWETLYWGHVFDAVAVGWLCWQESESNLAAQGKPL